MGGKGGGSVAPIYTAPVAAPQPEAAATLTLADEELTTEQEAIKKKAKTQGAKSLQIPLGGDTGSTTVGTGL